MTEFRNRRVNISKEVRRASTEYVNERQLQVESLLDAALTLHDIYTSEVYNGKKVVGMLETGQVVDATWKLPGFILSVAQALSEELDDMNAITPKIEEMWSDVHETYEIDVPEEEVDPEEPGDFPPYSLN